MEDVFSRRVLCVFVVFYGRLLITDELTGCYYCGGAAAQETTTETTAPDLNVTTGNFTSVSPEGPTLTPGTEGPTVTPGTEDLTPGTEDPTVTTASTQPPQTQGCLCDLTPDFCDIGCCCDTEDCAVSDLSSVFTNCLQETESGACVEKWLMFRANVDSSLVTETDSLFCVKPAEKTVSITESDPKIPALGDSYHFAPDEPAPATSTFTRDFYRVDDVILTFFSNSSTRGLLSFPRRGAASAQCTDRNPAQFLRSSTSSCSRAVTSRSCSTDPALNARSYVHDLSLIKRPVLETDPVAELLIPVTSSSLSWPEPSLQNSSCRDTVKSVEFLILYMERGEIVSVAVNVVVADVELEELFSQTHSIQFKLVTQTNPASTEAAPVVGLRVGSPVLGRFYDDVEPLSVIAVSQDGGCSSDSRTKIPLLFGYNSMSGCIFTSRSNNCSSLREQIYEVLRGSAVPDSVAMNSGPGLDWTRVITEECPVSAQESCDGGCTLPLTLSVQVLWARQGLLHLPQNYILGVKYVFHCSRSSCPLSSSLALSAAVSFAETTQHPEPPRGAPQTFWKFPFGFFSRGSDEVDQHLLLPNSGGSVRGASSLTLSVSFCLLQLSIWTKTGLNLD